MIFVQLPYHGVAVTHCLQGSISADKRSIEKLMSNLWINNVLPPGAVDERPLANHHPDVEPGGPIPVEVIPARTLPRAAAFYDQETDTLAVNILPFSPYDSFVESEDIRIDTDRFGSPIYIEVARTRKEWEIDPALQVPSSQDDMVLSIRQTTRRFPGGTLIADPTKSFAFIRLLARRGVGVYRIADHLLAELADGFLVGFWIDRIELDFGGRKQARWRAATATALRRSGIAWRPCSAGKKPGVC